MRSKLALVVVGLVVLPTALLSLMAGLLVKRWEMIAMRGLETAAANSVIEVRDHVDERLTGELDRVVDVFAAAVRAGSEFPAIQQAATGLEHARDLVAQSYLFMNPWGFVYPEGEGKEDAGPLNLTGALRRAVASAQPGATCIGFALDEDTYCFAPVQAKEGLYAGFRIHNPAVARILSTVMRYDTARGLALAARGLFSEEGGAIVVSDSLSGAVEVGEFSDLQVTEELARGTLAPPLDSIVVTAHADDPAQIEANARFTARLFGWGVLLLACVIIAGAAAVVREAMVEIREARASADFVGGISHDLRTPIASMKVLSESLYLGHVSGPQKRQEFLARMVTECDRLSQLVDRVLFFVRFGQNALVFGSRLVDPAALIQGAVDAFLSRTNLPPARDDGGSVDEDKAENAVASSETSVLMEVPLELPGIRVDEGALRQVLLNLLDNAVKYGRHGAPTRVIAESLRRARSPFSGEREWVRIAVRDEGIGIGRKDRERVFQKFYRTVGARDRNVSGVGLGLAVCRHVVKAHGGWMEVESEEGKGSTFSVFLPVA